MLILFTCLFFIYAYVNYTFNYVMCIVYIIFFGGNYTLLTMQTLRARPNDVLIFQLISHISVIYQVIY